MTLEQLAELEREVFLLGRWLFVGGGIGDPELRGLRLEQDVVQIGLHRDGTRHQLDGGLHVELAVPFLGSFGEQLVAVSGREQDAVFHRGRQQRVRLSLFDEREDAEGRFHADGRVRFAVGDDVEVLAGAAIVSEDADGGVEVFSFFEHLADEERHRHAGPEAEAAAPHFTDADVLGVHARDRADEAGVGDVDERDAAVRLGDDEHGVLLQTPVDGVVEHSAVIKRAVFRGRVRDREAAAMKQFGDEVAGSCVGRLEARSFGEAVEFLEILLRDVLLLDADDQLDAVSWLDLQAGNLDQSRLALHVQNVVHVRADFVPEQRSVLEAHLSRRAFQVQHVVAVDPFQPAFATSSHRLSGDIASAEGERQGDDNESKDAAHS